MPRAAPRRCMSTYGRLPENVGQTHRTLRHGARLPCVSHAIAMARDGCAFAASERERVGTRPGPVAPACRWAPGIMGDDRINRGFQARGKHPSQTHAVLVQNLLGNPAQAGYSVTRKEWALPSALRKGNRRTTVVIPRAGSGRTNNFLGARSEPKKRLRHPRCAEQSALIVVTDFGSTVSLPIQSNRAPSSSLLASVFAHEARPPVVREIRINGPVQDQGNQRIPYGPSR